MKKEDILGKLYHLFPPFEGRVKSYKKIGSRCIKFNYVKPVEIMTVNHERIFVQGDPNKDLGILTFLYNGDDDWTLGTKIWRNKPNGKGDE